MSVASSLAVRCWGGCSRRRRRRRPELHYMPGLAALRAAVMLLSAAQLSAAGMRGAATAQPQGSAAAARPSIVFIQTDDQDIELDSLQPMPQLRRLLQDQGATFSHWYVNTPVCCPSRSETLSGRYHHNLRLDRFPKGWFPGGDEAVGQNHPCGCMDINNTALALAIGETVILTTPPVYRY